MKRRTTENDGGGGAAASALYAVYPERRIPLNRAHMAVYAAAIIAAFTHRLASPYPLRFIFLVADAVLAFMWIVVQASRWSPVRRREFPDRLPSGDSSAATGLPDLDVFICTTDPRKEPPSGVASSALSAMAIEYPPEKIAVYVSDDGCSELTLYAFMMAAKFAGHWLPFCRETGIDERSPDIYFGSGGGGGGCGGEIEKMYGETKAKIESAMEAGEVTENLVSPQEYEIFRKWKRFTQKDHPAVIQVLLDSAVDKDIAGAPLPSLIYVSREKKTGTHHHFKAGAINALLRVSATMTAAPVILTLDCDMYVNDPGVFRRALCYFLSPEISSDLAYVQFPQRYPGINSADTYGSEIKRLYLLNPYGMDGLRGPNYVGTGCFYARRAFYGTPETSPVPPPAMKTLTEIEEEKKMRELLRDSAEKAGEVAGCGYEKGTHWGSTIGIRYGSLSEDYHTGYRQHCEGWRSVFSDPGDGAAAAFFCDIPVTLSDALGQNKRWCLGLLSVTLSKRSPILYGAKKVSILMALCYSYDALWTFWFIPIAIYGLLPQIALTCNAQLFPKVSDPWFFLYAYLFFASYGEDLLDFLMARGSFQTWWSDQRMWMIRGVTSYPFAAVQYFLQLAGIPAAGFNVTTKVVDGDVGKRYAKCMFEFGVASPFFVSISTFAVINMTSLAAGVLRAALLRQLLDETFAQIFLAGFVTANCWPVYDAMFVRKDAGRIPARVTAAAFFIAGLLQALGFFLF